MTGALDIGLTFSEAMVQQMTDLLRQTDPDIPERVFIILEEEVNAIIREETGALYEMLYPIYHKHLTLSDVNGLISFYETPLGSKVVSTLPLIAQESMPAGQQWGESLAANLGPRLMKRFEEEGIAGLAARAEGIDLRAILPSLADLPDGVTVTSEGFTSLGQYERTFEAVDSVFEMGSSLITELSTMVGFASDAADARFVAGMLGIPFYALNFQADFDRIIDYFADEYVRGRTPNPCVVCNDRLKFGKLVDYADAVDAHYIATGHYARIGTRDGRNVLMRGVDGRKVLQRSQRTP